MPRPTTLAVLVALALPVACAVPTRLECLPITAVVHVVDGQGAGDRVLVRLRHVQGHTDGIHEFVLPCAWEHLPTLPPVDGFARLDPMPQVQLAPRADIVVPRGETFSPEMIPGSRREDGQLLFNRHGVRDKRALDVLPSDEGLVAAQRTLEALLAPDRGLALDDALVARRRAYVAAADFDEATGVRTFWIAGLAHEPPRWVRLAEWHVDPVPKGDPYWETIDCGPPSAWATALHSTATMLIWFGWFALILGA